MAMSSSTSSIVSHPKKRAVRVALVCMDVKFCFFPPRKSSKISKQTVFIRTILVMDFSFISHRVQHSQSWGLILSMVLVRYTLSRLPSSSPFPGTSTRCGRRKINGKEEAENDGKILFVLCRKQREAKALFSCSPLRCCCGGAVPLSGNPRGEKNVSVGKFSSLACSLFFLSLSPSLCLSVCFAEELSIEPPLAMITFRSLIYHSYNSFKYPLASR
jgi:hypothetical protein